MATLRIFMLGPVQFHRDEQVIELRAAKAIALLAYLALADAPPLILQTHCLDTAQSLPLAPVTSFFRESICFERLFKPPSPLSPIWLAELAHLWPEIMQEWPELPQPLTLSPVDLPHGCTQRGNEWNPSTDTNRPMAG